MHFANCIALAAV